MTTEQCHRRNNLFKWSVDCDPSCPLIYSLIWFSVEGFWFIVILFFDFPVVNLLSISFLPTLQLILDRHQLQRPPRSDQPLARHRGLAVAVGGPVFRWLWLGGWFVGKLRCCLLALFFDCLLASLLGFFSEFCLADQFFSMLYGLLDFLVGLDWIIRSLLVVQLLICLLFVRSRVAWFASLLVWCFLFACSFAGFEWLCRCC